MGAPDALLLAILNGFTHEMYMIITKVAGIVCSFADIAFILILLKLAHALKDSTTPPPRKRVLVLYIFLALTPTLALPLSSDAFLLWQSFVLGIPYLFLAHAIVTEFTILLKHMREKIRPKLGN